VSDSTKKTWLARIATWFTNGRAKRQVRLNKREDARIRRVVAKETAMIGRESLKAQKRAQK
jgi:hypothetical protein